MHLTSGTLLQGGKYRISEKIGQGGFGIVYQAYHVGLKRNICIKEFFFRDLCERAENSKDVTIISKSDEKIQLVNTLKGKFFKEAQRLAQFRNKSIIQVMDNFEENNTVYFVMELLEGGSLEDKILRDGALGEQKAKEIIMPIINALDEVHKSGLLHLDIKPANIMFRKDHSPVLIDFGISKYMDISGGFTTTAPVGISIGYTPLEQYGGKVADFTQATDIYSLCATIYKMVTGITPQEPLQILRNGLKSPAQYNSTLSSDFANLITKGLSININERPQNISIIKEILFTGNCQNTEIISGSITPILINSSSEFKYNNNVIPLTPFIYDWAFNFSEGLAGVRKNDKWGFINKEGVEIIPYKYDQIEDFSEGFAKVCINEKWGFINKLGEEILPCKYDRVYNFENGFANVKPLYGDDYFINKEGNRFKPPTIDLIKYSYDKYYNNGFRPLKMADLVMFTRPFGGNLVGGTFNGYLDVDWFNEGLAPVKMRGLLPTQWQGKWGYIDVQEDMVIPLRFDRAYPFSEGLAPVKKNWDYGFINKVGDLIIPYEFSCVSSGLNGGFSEGLCWFTKKGKTGYINTNGVEVIRGQYNYAGQFSEGYAVVNIDKKYGLINKQGVEILPIQYEYVRTVSEGIAAVEKHGKCCYVQILK